MVICPERGADFHSAQLMPLPLTVSCFSKIQIGFTFLVPAHLGSPGKSVCVCVSVAGRTGGQCSCRAAGWQHVVSVVRADGTDASVTATAATRTLNT